MSEVPKNGNVLQMKPTGDALRRLNHYEWLRQCALAFEQQWSANGPEMTPFRQGLINRLRLAADYIQLLEKDARDLKLRMVVMRHASGPMTTNPEKDPGDDHSGR